MALAFPWGRGESRLGFSCLRGSSVPFGFLPMVPCGSVSFDPRHGGVSLLEAVSTSRKIVYWMEPTKTARNRRFPIKIIKFA